MSTSLWASPPPAPQRLLQLLRAAPMVRARERAEASLTEFTANAWRYIDPAPFVAGRHIDAICEHLEAVTNGDIRRLLINIPPRLSKSSLVAVAWPAWTWAQSESGPTSGPETQFLFASYAQSLSLRDSVKCRRLIESPYYQQSWAGRFALTGDQNTKIRFENNRGGYRLATSVGGALTGEGAAIICIDDPHNTIEMESQVQRQGVAMWWDEALSTRLNDPRTGAYVIIMQRLHEDDLSGHILTRDIGEWCHLCLPMEFDSSRSWVTSIGWKDWRKEDGELLCPDRFGPAEVEHLKATLGPFGAAGQLQQSPEPRGGGIFKREWWKLYDVATALAWEMVATHDAERLGEKALVFPPSHYKVASFDGAFGLKEENDWSAVTIWSAFTAPRFKGDAAGNPRLMLEYAWRGRLPLHETPMTPDEKRMGKERIGLVEKVADICKRYRVDRLLIEDKANGKDMAREIRRLNSGESWGVTLVNPGSTDKVTRAYAVQHLFSEGLIYAPDRVWSDLVISEMASFPKGSHDDLVDTATMALRHLRLRGFAPMAHEQTAEAAAKARWPSQAKLAPVYPA